MKYLELGMNRDHYSVAFRRYRNNLLTANVSYLLTGAAILIAAWVIYKQVKKKKVKKGGVANG